MRGRDNSVAAGPVFSQRRSHERVFDSHAHYDDERFDADRDELLESIHREGVEYIMTIGADLPTSYAARELAERYDFVYFAAGITRSRQGTPPKTIWKS